MKNQTLFSSKDKSKKLKYRLLQFLFCALRVNRLGFCFHMLNNCCYSACSYMKDLAFKGQVISFSRSRVDPR